MRLKQLLAPLPNAGASVIITLIFVGFFCALCWYVYRKDRKRVYSHLEQLPLEETRYE